MSAVTTENDLRLRQMKAALVKCCEAGRVAYPDPCPWHGRDLSTGEGDADE